MNYIYTARFYKDFLIDAKDIEEAKKIAKDKLDVFIYPYTRKGDAFSLDVVHGNQKIE